MPSLAGPPSLMTASSSRRGVGKASFEHLRPLDGVEPARADLTRGEALPPGISSMVLGVVAKPPHAATSGIWSAWSGRRRRPRPGSGRTPRRRPAVAPASAGRPCRRDRHRRRPPSPDPAAIPARIAEQDERDPAMTELGTGPQPDPGAVPGQPTVVTVRRACSASDGASRCPDGGATRTSPARRLARRCRSAPATRTPAARRWRARAIGPAAASRAAVTGVTSPRRHAAMWAPARTSESASAGRFSAMTARPGLVLLRPVDLNVTSPAASRPQKPRSYPVPASMTYWARSCGRPLPAAIVEPGTTVRLRCASRPTRTRRASRSA